MSKLNQMKSTLRFTFMIVVILTRVHAGNARGHHPPGQGHHLHGGHHREHHSGQARPPSGPNSQTDLSLTNDFKNGVCLTFVTPNGYGCEEYTVQTEDGFILAVQHVTSRMPVTSSNGIPVYLQHGVLAGGEVWFINGPGLSLGYILADAGFDVWVGNTRCNPWSHGHVHLTSDDQAYWNWSTDEMAKYDLAAMLEIVHAKTSHKIFYLGHSMGTTLVLQALISQATHLKEMLRGVALICPTSIMTHVTSVIDQLASHLLMDQVYALFSPSKFDFRSDAVNKLIDTVCAIPNTDCQQLQPNLGGRTCCINPKRVPLYLRYYPQPTSTRTIAHFAQMVRRDPFSKFDFGFLENLFRYGQPTPPKYDFSNFPSSVPILMVSGQQDAVSDPFDVATLARSLSQSVRASIILPAYAHLDFLVSETANVDVWQNVTTWFLTQT